MMNKILKYSFRSVALTRCSQMLGDVIVAGVQLHFKAASPHRFQYLSWLP